MQHNGLPAALSIQKVKKSEFSSIKIEVFFARVVH